MTKTEVIIHNIKKGIIKLLEEIPESDDYTQYTMEAVHSELPGIVTINYIGVNPQKNKDDFIKFKKLLTYVSDGIINIKYEGNEDK